MSLHQALQQLDYPCDYPFKLICKPDAVDRVRAKVLQSLGEQTRIKDVHQRASRTGKFVSLSIKAQVSSGDQVVQVYADLEGEPGIVTSL